MQKSLPAWRVSRYIGIWIYTQTLDAVDACVHTHITTYVCQRCMFHRYALHFICTQNTCINSTKRCIASIPTCMHTHAYICSCIDTYVGVYLVHSISIHMFICGQLVHSMHAVYIHTCIVCTPYTNISIDIFVCAQCTSIRG